MSYSVESNTFLLISLYYHFGFVFVLHIYTLWCLFKSWKDTFHIVVVTFNFEGKSAVNIKTTISGNCGLKKSPQPSLHAISRFWRKFVLPKSIDKSS